MREQLSAAKIKSQERAHGKKIQHDAEQIWGWGTPAGKMRLQRRLKEFLACMGLAQNKSVLEIGCGVGLFTHLLRKDGIRPVAVDISYDLLKKAKDGLPRQIFLQADAESLPFCGKVFDCVVGVSVLHHLNIERALKNIATVLKDGGVIVFSEPNMANPQVFLQKKVGWLKKITHDTPTETAFLRWRLEKLLTQSGFSGISIYPFDFLHPYTPVSFIPAVKWLEKCLERTPFIKEIAGSLLIVARKDAA